MRKTSNLVEARRMYKKLNIIIKQMIVNNEENFHFQIKYVNKILLKRTQKIKNREPKNDFIYDL